MPPIAVIDFETTGMSPGMGARATEVAIVLVEGDRVVRRFQSLMRSGAWVPPFIESLTGITNAMLADAPPAHEVMLDAARFVGSAPLVAHNASFDRSFWQTELARAGEAFGAPPPAAAANPFACTVLLSRRLYPEAQRYSLGALKAFHDLASAGRAHRALADAEVTAALLLRILRDLERQWDVFDASHALLMQIQQSPRKALKAVLLGWRQATESPTMAP